MSYVFPTPWHWLHLNQARCSADQLLLRLGVRTAPVDVAQIAGLIGAEVHFATGTPWDGAVDSYLDGTARIWVNANQAAVRQRFTIAHELGHLLLHPPGQAFRDTFSPGRKQPAEREADNFAADLLMPSWLVHAYAPGASIDTLAATFDVSRLAMQIKLENLGYRLA